VGEQYLWLFDLPLPPNPPAHGVVQCTLRVDWTDHQNQSGYVERSFQIEYSVHPEMDMTGITWPQSGNAIPTSNFVPYGRLDALLLSSAAAPCSHGYPCLLDLSGPTPTLINPTSGPFEDPIVLHRWHAVYATLPAGHTFSLQVIDVNSVGQKVTGLTT
jgi:hypothetical protein